MTFLGPLEDFVHTTLAALPGLLRRLQYVAGLRGGDGQYTHWGMSRVHGGPAASRATGDAHRQVFSDVLRTPLSKLLADAGNCAADQKTTPVAYVQSLAQQADSLIPPEVSPAPKLHFNSVLHALSALARSRPRANRPAS